MTQRLIMIKNRIKSQIIELKMIEVKEGAAVAEEEVIGKMKTTEEANSEIRGDLMIRRAGPTTRGNRSQMSLKRILKKKTFPLPNLTIRILLSSQVVRMVPIIKFAPEWKEVEEDEVVLTDKTIVKIGQPSRDSIDKNNTARLLSAHPRKVSITIKRASSLMRRRKKVTCAMIKVMLKVSTKGKIITSEEGMIITIVSSMIRTKNNTTEIKSTDKQIDRSTTITKKTKTGSISANTNQKNRTRILRTKEIRSMRRKILKSRQMMIIGNQENSIKTVVDSMLLKTKAIKGRMWIQVTRSYNKKWSLRPRSSK